MGEVMENERVISHFRKVNEGKKHKRDNFFAIV